MGVGSRSAPDRAKPRHYCVLTSTKTGRSRRTIRVLQSLIEAILTLPSYAVNLDRVILNKFGGALDANHWAKDYWPRMLEGLGIRHRNS